MLSSIRFKSGDVIHKIQNGQVDTSAKYKIKEIFIENEYDWHSGYDVTIKAVIYKLGVSSDLKDLEEEYILQYMNHGYQMDNIYATVTGLSPTKMACDTFMKRTITSFNVPAN
jgi:hypothetical protein